MLPENLLMTDHFLRQEHNLSKTGYWNLILLMDDPCAKLKVMLKILSGFSSASGGATGNMLSWVVSRCASCIYLHCFSTFWASFPVWYATHGQLNTLHFSSDCFVQLVTGFIGSVGVFNSNVLVIRSTGEDERIIPTSTYGIWRGSQSNPHTVLAIEIGCPMRLL